MLPVVDANIVLRYLLNDDAIQHNGATRAIRAGCETTIEVLAEVVYVLKGVYKVPREEIAQTLECLLDELYVERHDEAICALELYGEHNLDFVDCVLAAQHAVSGREIVTFDKALRRLLN